MKEEVSEETIVFRTSSDSHRQERLRMEDKVSEEGFMFRHITVIGKNLSLIHI